MESPYFENLKSQIIWCLKVSSQNYNIYICLNLFSIIFKCIYRVITRKRRLLLWGTEDCCNLQINNSPEYDKCWLWTKFSLAETSLTESSIN